MKKRMHYSDFLSNQWCPPEAHMLIMGLFLARKNILIVGATSSGKTTLLQSLLDLTYDTERCILIEDTRELEVPNKSSISLLAREKQSDAIDEVSLEDLVKRALRLRPDRLIVGEVRGAEAYSLLLALSTGHSGSLSSIHASSSKQALLRLEMLVQLGAPQWDLRAIRRLIHLSINYIIVGEKTSTGRRLKEVCELKSVEESGITLETKFSAN